MKKQEALVQTKQIERSIIFLRGQKVMLDADIAVLYSIPTKALKQAVKRNADRFPSDFMFELTEEEKLEVVTNCDHLAKLKFSPYLPFAFTEHGALMLANVLNSSKAVQVSIQIIRTFNRLRKLVDADKYLSPELERIGEKYDRRIKVLFKNQKLPPATSGGKGFRIEDQKAFYSSRKNHKQK